MIDKNINEYGKSPTFDMKNIVMNGINKIKYLDRWWMNGKSVIKFILFSW